MSDEKPKLLLHACCAPCSTHPIRLLQDLFRVTVHFYNPNIHPETECIARRKEMERLAFKWNVPFLGDVHDPERWFNHISGRENDAEGSTRCALCFEMRLSRTAQKAKELGFPYFGTTLTISPHKDAGTINRIGEKIAKQVGISFVRADFKKKDGFLIAGRIGREEGLYRQNYCGCVFSRRRA